MEPWEQFDESGMVQEWVTAAYVAEGKTRLPFWSSYARSDRPAPFGVNVPTQEELRALFGDEARFQQWLAGEDFQYGLADVRDADFEARCEAVEAAVRALVEQGTVRQGWSVSLPTVPMPFLQTAHLVEGEWVDAYVVELAEWGALLRKKGFVFKDPDDNSPVAWERIGKATKDGFVEADEHTPWKNRNASRTRLAAFPGRSRGRGKSWSDTSK